MNNAQKVPQKNLIEEIPATVTHKSSNLMKHQQQKEIKFRLFENKLFKFIVGEFHLKPVVSYA